jgi:hypothetical protein
MKIQIGDTPKQLTQGLMFDGEVWTKERIQALQAQLEQLREVTNYYQQGQVPSDEAINELIHRINLTPAQCLAERDADAMEAAGKYLLSLITAPPSLHFTSADALYKRANKLRQAAKGGE